MAMNSVFIYEEYVEWGVIRMMHLPSKEVFKDFFRQMPSWVLLLILVMLFGRFVLTAVWAWLS